MSEYSTEPRTENDEKKEAEDSAQLESYVDNLAELAAKDATVSEKKKTGGGGGRAK